MSYFALLFNIFMTAAIALMVCCAFYLWFPLHVLDGQRFGSTITTIQGTDTLSASRSVLNTNFSNLNTDKIESTNIDTCAEIAAIVSGETGTCGSLVLSVSPTFTGVTTVSSASSTNLDVSTYLKVGSSGTTIAELRATTCNLSGMNTSQAASSSKAYPCAITGAASGAAVMAMLATSTPVGGQSYWSVIGAKASSTASFIDVMVWNNGPAAVPSVTSVGSSTNIWYVK